MLGVKCVVEPYNPEEFFSATEGLEKEKEGGERCLRCFALRLLKAAEFAGENGFDYFTTSLTISPLKNAEDINRLGEKIGEMTKVKYLFSDFKKGNGYMRSIELSKVYGLYRQNYCGCVFSEKENVEKQR